MLSVRGGASLGLGVACDEFVATRKIYSGVGSFQRSATGALVDGACQSSSTRRPT